MIQGGDPTGTGKGGTSIWGKKFNDEIKESLKVCNEMYTVSCSSLITLDSCSDLNTTGDMLIVQNIASLTMLMKLRFKSEIRLAFLFQAVHICVYF